ncbi:hypothetical protein CTR2_R27340 [Comamonas thiooxydans]|mgnify:CR=1 FL=1|uniref:hypothetical protein n=1 Tax=Comamonas thiooxydans TaxID=363952 RepID=UPI00112134C9|nr:hypothetical protein [Comamonas thiooxydans]BDR09396.1 hypothetical protein CTR2_R27340 [Comamonas thiooxydans]
MVKKSKGADSPFRGYGQVGYVHADCYQLHGSAHWVSFAIPKILPSLRRHVRDHAYVKCEPDHEAHVQKQRAKPYRAIETCQRWTATSWLSSRTAPPYAATFDLKNARYLSKPQVLRQDHPVAVADPLRLIGAFLTNDVNPC